jgi:hypothetical protein
MPDVAAMAAIAMTITLAILLFVMPSVAGSPIPVVNTTLAVKESGAINVVVMQIVPDNTDGTNDYYFELNKMYSPENVIVYDYETGKPLKYDMKDKGSVYGYEVHFDRPYYNGYIFVVEYDCHRRITYEGKGVYSLGFRGSVDTRVIDRYYTVLLPTRNFTYLGFNEAMDHPVSETNNGNAVIIGFHNVSDAGAGYAWEVRFGATGIENEVHKTEVPDFKTPMPGMSFIAAITALVILAISCKR